MASYTTNLNLVKPTINDPFNVEDANSNMQKIDDAYVKVITLTGATAPTTSTAGAVGQFYVHRTVDGVYKGTYICLEIVGSIYTWKLIYPKGAYELIQTYSTPGSFTWTAPDLYGDGQPYEICVLIDGAGGSGCAGVYYTSSSSYPISASGGGAGCRKIIKLTVTPGNTYPIVVGAGGDAKSVTASSMAITGGSNNGGASSFNGTSALGGYGGSYVTSGYDSLLISGQSSNGARYISASSKVPRMGMPAFIQTGSSNNDTRINPNLCTSAELANPFDPTEIGFSAGAGAGASYSTTYTETVLAGLSEGVVGTPRTQFNNAVGTYTVTATSTTAPSSGGSAAVGFLYYNGSEGSQTAVSGKGGNGRVRIYAKGVN